jgi:transcriptional regulator with XRE-family HTH domain
MTEYRKRSLQARLIRLGFTQATLAGEVGASRSFVGKLLRGERRSSRLEPMLCDQLRLRRRRLYPPTNIYRGRSGKPVGIYYDHEDAPTPKLLYKEAKPCQSNKS